MTCTRCGGSGLIRQPTPQPPDTPITELRFDPGDECPVCHGLGTSEGEAMAKGKAEVLSAAADYAAEHGKSAMVAQLRTWAIAEKQVSVADQRIGAKVLAAVRGNTEDDAEVFGAKVRAIVEAEKAVAIVENADRTEPADGR